MTFIPNKGSVGSTVVLTKDVRVLKGTFQAGTVMTVTGLSNRGLDMVDGEGNILLEVYDPSSYRFD